MARTQEANERMRAESRARILAAAERVFAGRGFFAARISDIAAEAGMSTGSLYWYFPAKEDVLAAVISAALDAQAAMLEGVAALPGPARERLDVLAARSLALLEQQRGLERILLSARAAPGLLESLGVDLGAAYARQDACLERIFAGALREGALAAGGSPSELAALYRALLRGLALDDTLSVDTARAALLRLLGWQPAPDARTMWKRSR